MKKLKILIMLFLCLIFTPGVSAKTVNHFYAEAGDDVAFSEEVNGSSALAGQNVESNGKILGVNFLAGNKISHEGYSDYLVSAGNYVTISGEVNNDAIVAGNIIEVSESASLKRDVIILGEDITIKGSLGRNVSLFGNKVSLVHARISGNVKIYAEEITVDSDSIVEGTLSYPSDAEATIGENIKSIKKTAPIKKDVTNNFATVIYDKLWSFLSLLVIFAALTLLTPKLFDKINNSYEKLDFNRGAETIAKGLVFLMIIPVVATFLLVIPFALPLSLIMFILYFISIYVSKVFSIYLIGYKLWQKFFKKDINILVLGILGFTVVFILDLIPGISFIVSLFTLLFGVGIISEFIFQKKKEA